MPIRIDGLADITRAFQHLKAQVDGPTAEQVALDAGKLIKAEFERQAPRGPTGRLARSGLVFRGRKASRLGAYAIFWLRFRFAPHAPLIEFGTGDRVPKKAKVMKLAAGVTGTLFRRRVKGTPPNPVFAHSVEATAAEVVDHILAREKELIERTAKF